MNSNTNTGTSKAAKKSIFSASKPSQRNNKEDSSTKFDADKRQKVPPPQTNRHQDDVMLGGKMGNFMNPELPTTVKAGNEKNNEKRKSLNYVSSMRKFDSDLTEGTSRTDSPTSPSSKEESQHHHPDIHVALPPSMSEEAELRKKFKVPTQPGTPEEPSHRLHVQELREAEMEERAKLLQEEMVQREEMEVERRREAEERAVRIVVYLSRLTRTNSYNTYNRYNNEKN